MVPRTKRIAIALAAAAVLGGAGAAVSMKFADPRHRDIIGHEAPDDGCVGPALPPGCDPSKPLDGQPACPQEARPSCDPVVPTAIYGAPEGYGTLLAITGSFAAIGFLFAFQRVRPA